MRQPSIIERSRYRSALAHALAYALGVAVAKYVVGFAAALLARCVHQLLTHASVGKSDAIVFYAENWLIFNVTAGALIGFILYSERTSRLPCFVWLPFAMVLAYKVITYSQSVFAQGSMVRFHHFFATGCTDISVQPAYISPECADQFLYTLPFYGSLGFSIGVFLRQVFGRRLPLPSLVDSLTFQNADGSVDDHD